MVRVRVSLVVLGTLLTQSCASLKDARLVAQAPTVKQVQGPAVCGPVAFRRAPLLARWGEYVRVTVQSSRPLRGSAMVHAGGVMLDSRGFAPGAAATWPEAQPLVLEGGAAAPAAPRASGQVVLEAYFSNGDVEARSALRAEVPLDVTLSGLVAEGGSCEGAVFVVEHGALAPSVDERAWVAELERRAGPELAAKRAAERAAAEERRQSHYAAWEARRKLGVSAELLARADALRAAHYAAWDARRAGMLMQLEVLPLGPGCEAGGCVAMGEAGAEFGGEAGGGGGVVASGPVSGGGDVTGGTTVNNGVVVSSGASVGGGTSGSGNVTGGTVNTGVVVSSGTSVGGSVVSGGNVAGGTVNNGVVVSGGTSVGGSVLVNGGGNVTGGTTVNNGVVVSSRTSVGGGTSGGGSVTGGAVNTGVVVSSGGSVVSGGNVTGGTVNNGVVVSGGPSVSGSGSGGTTVNNGVIVSGGGSSVSGSVASGTSVNGGYAPSGTTMHNDVIVSGGSVTSDAVEVEVASATITSDVAADVLVDDGFVLDASAAWRFPSDVAEWVLPTNAQLRGQVDVWVTSFPEAPAPPVTACANCGSAEVEGVEVIVPGIDLLLQAAFSVPQQPVIRAVPVRR